MKFRRLQMKRILLLTILGLVFGIMANAQYRVSGTVLDQKDGQGLPGATATLVSAETGKLVGNSTDIDGKFSIRVNEGKYTLKVVFLGYGEYEKTIDVKGDMSVGTIKLKAETKELDEVKAVGTMVLTDQVLYKKLKGSSKIPICINIELIGPLSENNVKNNIAIAEAMIKFGR